MKRSVFSIATVLLLSILHHAAIAQQPVSGNPADKDTLVPLHILRADRIREETRDSAKFQSLIGNVELQRGTTYFYCDSVVINNKAKIIEAFGKVHMNDSDTTHIFSEYMKYFEDKKYVMFQKHVKMTDGKATLFTDDLQYDLNQKIGTYQNGGKVVNETSVLTSKEGVYYADTKDVYFKKNVFLKDPSYELKSDSLLYNTQSQLATFITETFIKDSSGNTIATKEGIYDLKNHKAQFGKRPVIHQGSQKIVGDNVQFDDVTGRSIATGNAIYTDTAQGISILANYLIADKKTKTFLATETPLMILKQEADSIYITADTLFSGKLTDLLKADSIKRHDDSVQTAIARIKDSIHDDSVKRVQARISDSLKIINAQIARENQRKKDSLELAHIDIPNSVFLKGVIAEENILKNPIAKNKPDRRPIPKVPVKQKENLVKEEMGALTGIPKDSTKKGPPKTDSSLAKKEIAGKIHDTTSNLPIAQKDTAMANIKAGIQDSSDKKTSAGTSTLSDSADRYLQAYHHVRIYSDSLQAVADSLFYSGKDSVFQLFTNPIVWANGSQVTGDTIFLYTKNKKASRLYVFENGLAVNKVGDNLFNQIKGTTLNGYFKDGVIDYMRAKGNAESIYYAQDDNKAFFGVNQSKADIIDMIFVNKELNKVLLRNDAEGTMFPIKKVNFDEMRLRNFKWLDDKRPKSKYELFENKNQSSQEQQHE